MEIHTKPGRVFPTQDGERVAWFALRDRLATIDQFRKNDHGVFLHEVGALKIYDSVHGARNHGNRWYRGLCLWLSDDELERIESFDRLPGF